MKNKHDVDDIVAPKNGREKEWKNKKKRKEIVNRVNCVKCKLGRILNNFIMFYEIDSCVW